MGKAEGHGENWHSHVTALTVGPEYRRLGVAATLMAFLEEVSEKWVLQIYYINNFKKKVMSMRPSVVKKQTEKKKRKFF